MKLVIGTDFDNTVVSYDELMKRIAVEGSLLDASEARGKKQIRDAIRSSRGDFAWQQVQALAYGRRMGEAKLIDGVREFFRLCKEKGVKVCIISHKTQHSNLDRSVDLRSAALGWMEQNSFFSGDGLCLRRDDVFFEPTKEAKIERIKEQGCTHFIDDLEETFLDASFPRGVGRILYAPHKDRVMDGVDAFADWEDISGYFFGVRREVAHEELKAAFSKLLKEDVLSVAVMGGGRNTRVHLVRTGKESLIVKEYFRNVFDRRDRMRAEFSSIKLLWDNGIRNVPMPIAMDEYRHLGVYGHIAGERVSDIEEHDIDEAVSFLVGLLPLREKAGMLPPASEACFSVEGLVSNIRGRLGRLNEAPRQSVEERAMHGFVEEELSPSLEKIVGWCTQRLAEEGLPFGQELGMDERILSPSDFGFHNALRTGGGLAFLDFEYFGWDDPAKTISDFLLHPAMSLDKELKGRFVLKMVRGLESFKYLPKRLEIVYPLYGLKWCLILLNEFVPEYLLRRNFASKCKAGLENVHEAQLEKAANALERTMSEYRKFPYRTE